MRNLTLLFVVACSTNPKTPPPAAPDAAAEDPVALEVVGSMNPEADACVDFYEYACGGWRANTELPADRSIVTRSFTRIADENQQVLRELLEQAAAAPGDDPVQQKLGAFFGACMDTDAIEAAGVAPLQALWDEVDAAGDDREALLRVAGHFASFGPNPFLGGGPWADPKDPDNNILHLGQEGLGLPDRSYYLDLDDDGRALLEDYRLTIVALFQLGGMTEAQAVTAADDVVAFETELAKTHWERAELRDADRTYNKMTLAELEALATGAGADGKPTKAGAGGRQAGVRVGPWLEGLGVRTDTPFNVSTPSAIAGMAALVAATEPAALRAYLKWHITAWAAPHLPSELDARSFAFFGTRLNGTRAQQERWKRCVSRTDAAMGEWLGRAYVDQRFAGDSKAIAQEMVDGIFAAFESNLPELAWMDDATRERAVEKARAFRAKLGFPNEFRDYSALDVSGGAHLEHVRKAAAFNSAFALAKVGQPVDKDEWHMTPQTVNAYYNPTGNEIVFPAGIMQAPFFDRTYPRAMNYGALGMVIGHELTHGFDDEGRKYSPTGELKEWWEPEVSARFEEQAQCVEEQYGGWEVAGVPVNGKLTLGENIADLGGLKMAQLAYRDWVAQNGPEPELGGLTGEQLLFVAFAQGWCTIATEEVERVRAATDPHSPPRHRVNGPVMNLPAFAEAFGCEPGSPMAPEDRCEVW